MAIAYDGVINAVVERRLAPVYGKNFPLGDTDYGVKSALERVPYNTNPAINDCLAKCPGINVPTFYLAGQGSFTPIHQEDGFLDACNFVHWGDPSAKYHKLWLLVHPNDTYRCINAMRKDIAKLFPENDHLLEHVGDMGCSGPHYHKNIVVTAAWLKQRNIKFEIIDQRHGDLLYLAPTILHQVVNLSVNFAEACNVGSPMWNRVAEAFVGCTCPNNHTIFVEPNRDVVTEVTQRDVRVFVCEELDCTYETMDKELMASHTSTMHQGLKGFKCARCVESSKLYLTKNSLYAHTSVYHRGKLVVRCELCGKFYSTINSYRRHKRNVHGVGL